MLIAALLLAASQPSVIPSLSDEQLCQSLERTYAKAAGLKMGPATILQSGPDCRAKTLNNHLSVALTGDQGQKFVSVFMENADANLCHSTDPTVVAFKARRWGWLYEFRFADGSVINKRLGC
jgi:hypothetical protein